MNKSELTFEEHIKEIREFNNLSKIKVAFVPSSISNMLLSFDSDVGESLVTWEQLRQAKIGERNEVNSKVSFEKVDESDNHQRFLTYMEEGGSFGVQKHDCYEVCKIIKGNLIEPLRGYSIYSEGDQILYAPYEKHKPQSSSQSIYEVIFYKNL